MGEFYQTKAEFYKTLIDIHKKHGQGLSGIVCAQSSLLKGYTDELIEEGLIKCCDTGGSLGHPESNRFYCPTKGYCVWDDMSDKSIARNSLTCVRFYLGALEPDSPSRTDMQRALFPSLNDLIREPYFMEKYAEWLKKNDESLKEMLNLSDEYNVSETELSDDSIKYLKTRSWYKDNLTVSKCIKELISGDSSVDEGISLTKRILALQEDKLKLYETKKDKKGVEESQKEIEDSKKELENYKLAKKLRPKIKVYLQSQDQKITIKELI
jgi:predicted DNA-binding protein YlxM (UPF0122 family)